MRFGLMVNGTFLHQWQNTAVRQLLNEGHELVLVVMRSEPARSKSLIGWLRGYPYKYLLYRLWQRFVFRPRAKTLLDISDMLSTVRVIRCTPQTKGSTDLIPDETAEKVRAHELDFLLRFGFNILQGSILDVPRYGIWSFHHDDEQTLRGGPPGFWEVYHKHDVNGVVLQRLTARLDAGLVLSKIWLPVIKHSYKAHLDTLLRESAFMPAHVCRQITRQGLNAWAPQTHGPLYRNPKNLTMMRFAMVMPLRRIGFHLHQLFRHESWKIGVAELAPTKLLRTGTLKDISIRWVSHPDKAKYLADPFVVHYQGQTIMLAELFDYRKGRGQVVRLMPDEGFSVVPVNVPDGMHRSFPFLFEFEGRLHCLPECHVSGELVLYEFDPVNNSLVQPRVLISDIDALDPVLFPYDGMWWLMFSRKHLPGVQLYAWYAKHPYGPFHPHPLNPLKTDPRSARNAGTPFEHEGQLIRPGQMSAGAYGKALVFNKIEVLTLDDYRETEIGRLEPLSIWDANQGLHNLSGTDKISLFDAKSYCFSLAGLRHVWGLKTHRNQ